MVKLTSKYKISEKTHEVYSQQSNISESLFSGTFEECCDYVSNLDESIANVSYIRKLSSLNTVTEDLDDEISEIEQEFTSQNTSINSTKLPAIFKLVKFEPNTINLDYGGGKFDNAAEYLKEFDVTNLVYDPYNRTAAHNSEVIKTIKQNGGADSATCSNVLNVVKEENVRINILNNIKKLVKPNGKIYITVYEGSGSGDGAPTKAGYQMNRKTDDYLEEIKSVFPDATRRGKLITTTNSNSSKLVDESISGSELHKAPLGTKLIDANGRIYVKGQHYETPWKSGDDRYSSWYLANASKLNVRYFEDNTSEVANEAFDVDKVQKRIARYSEFDNGYVLHTWYKMSSKEAEDKAKEASIKDPNDIYYVAYDNIMEPCSDIRWKNGQQLAENYMSDDDYDRIDRNGSDEEQLLAAIAYQYGVSIDKAREYEKELTDKEKAKAIKWYNLRALPSKIRLKKMDESLNDPDEVLNFKRDIELADSADDIQDLIYSLSDGVAEDNCQTAFYENEDKDLQALKNAVISALDVYLEDNEWLGESKSIKESNDFKYFKVRGRLDINDTTTKVEDVIIRATSEDDIGKHMEALGYSGYSDVEELTDKYTTLGPIKEDTFTKHYLQASEKDRDRIDDWVRKTTLILRDALNRNNIKCDCHNTYFGHSNPIFNIEMYLSNHINKVEEIAKSVLKKQGAKRISVKTKEVKSFYAETTVRCDISHLFNNSISEGIFDDKFTEAELKAASNKISGKYGIGRIFLTNYNNKYQLNVGLSRDDEDKYQEIAEKLVSYFGLSNGDYNFDDNFIVINVTDVLSDVSKKINEDINDIEKVVSKYDDAFYNEDEKIIDCASEKTCKAIAKELNIGPENTSNSPVAHLIYLDNGESLTEDSDQLDIKFADDEPEKYIKLDLMEPDDNYSHTIGGKEVPYKSHDEAKRHLKDFKFSDYEKELYEFLRSKDMYNEMYVEPDNTLCIRVENGDWKHEHLYLDNLIHKFFFDKGLIIDSQKEVTSSDNSDCFSANHYYRIVDVIFVSSLKDVDESLNESTNNKYFALMQFESGSEGPESDSFAMLAVTKASNKEEAQKYFDDKKFYGDYVTEIPETAFNEFNTELIEEDRLEDINFVMSNYVSRIFDKVEGKDTDWTISYHNETVNLKFDPSYGEYVYTLDGEGPYSHSSYEFISRDIMDYIDTHKIKSEDTQVKENTNQQLNNIKDSYLRDAWTFEPYVGSDKDNMFQTKVHRNGLGTFSVYVKGFNYNNLEELQELSEVKIQVAAIKPYDDAEYHWAKYENNVTKIIKNGRVVKKIPTDLSSMNPDSQKDAIDFVICDICNTLADLNMDIEPKMVHN